MSIDLEAIINRGYPPSIQDTDALIAEVRRLAKAEAALAVLVKGDPVETTRAGHYVSTYCLHDLHADCRLTCKTCKAPCRCACHRTPFVG